MAMAKDGCWMLLQFYQNCMAFSLFSMENSVLLYFQLAFFVVFKASLNTTMCSSYPRGGDLQLMLRSDKSDSK